MTSDTYTERKQFIRALNLNDIQAATRLVCNPTSSDIAQWVERYLWACDSSEMLDCLLQHYSVSDEALSEALISAARKADIPMVENLIARGAKDGSLSEALGFAIVNHSKDIAHIIAPVSDLTSLPLEAMDPITRELYEEFVSETLRNKLNTEISAQIPIHKPAKKM